LIIAPRRETPQSSFWWQRGKWTAQTVLNLTIDPSAVQRDEASGDQDDLTYQAGDCIGLQVVTAGFTPTTSDAVGILELDDGL